MRILSTLLGSFHPLNKFSDTIKDHKVLISTLMIFFSFIYSGKYYHVLHSLTLTEGHKAKGFFLVPRVTFGFH